MSTYERTMIEAATKALHGRGVVEMKSTRCALGQKPETSAEEMQAQLALVEAAYADFIASIRGTDFGADYAEQNANISGADKLHWARQTLAGRYA